MTVIMSKLGNVIDIMAAAAGTGARIDTWPPSEANFTAFDKRL